MPTVPVAEVDVATSFCREGCCGVRPRLTVSELFERGFRRNRTAPLACKGAACTDAEGNTARFSLDYQNGVIAAVGFRASTCATLIAYCEFIAEIVIGYPLEQAWALAASDLVDGVGSVPAMRRQRAILAGAAFRSALAAVSSRPAEPQGSVNESRLHFRHPAA
jgi:NifU-like protein involved in Fe-S cluster formation